MAQREDLAAFERGFLAVDRSFSPDARAKANKRMAALSADAGPISDTRFVLALSEIAALADNGHTGVIYRGVTMKSLDPEVAAPWTLEAYEAGRDPGMEAASRVLRPR